MPASIGYSDDKKKEYAGRFIGGAISFLIKKLGVPEEFADSAGDEIGGFLAGVELSKDNADTAEKHWDQALGRTWTQMRKKIDLSDEFWEPLEEELFVTPDTITLFLESYGKGQKSDNDHERDNIGILSEVDRIIEDIHKDSDNIDTDSIPEDFSKELIITLKQEIRNDISLSAIIQNLILAKKISDIKELPYKESTNIPLTMIPAPVELIGRENDITAIRDVSTQNNVVSIRADGGVGKTAVAAKIINDMKGEIERGESAFKHVAWVTSTGDLKNDLSKLEVPAVEADGSADKKFQQVFRFLQEYPTFLIIDNMDTPPNADDATIINTISGRTKILITTRAAISRFKPYPLMKMDKQNAITLFFKHYLNSLSAPLWQEIENRADMVYVEKIIDAATHNALLVELIAKMACWEYIDNLKDLWDVLEEKDVFGTDWEIEIETDHAYSHLSMDDLKIQGQIRNLYRISTLNDTQQELMRFFAVFPPEAIIFADTFKWAGFKVSDLKYLTERGWIERAGDGFLIHTMVKGSIELQDGDFDIEKYENLIKELSDTDQYMPVSMVYTKKAERIIVPDTVCRLLIEKRNPKKTVVILFQNLAGVYYTQGNYAGALKYYEKAVAISEEVLGKNHPSTAGAYNNLALLYQAQGNYAEALKYYEKAVAISEEVLGKNHPSTAAIYNNLALVYREKGNYAEALKYYEKAVAIREDVLGKNHPSTVGAYNNLALVYQAQGNYAEALKNYEKAVAISEEVLGKKHPDTATIYGGLALVYQEQGNYAEALEYYEKALTIYEEILGEKHSNTASTYDGLAGVYEDQGNYAKALQYYKKALAIREELQGEKHPDSAGTYNNLGILYLHMQQYTKAKRYLQKAYDIYREVLGNDHPYTIITQRNLEFVKKEMGK